MGPAWTFYRWHWALGFPARNGFGNCWIWILLWVDTATGHRCLWVGPAWILNRWHWTLGFPARNGKAAGKSAQAVERPCTPAPPAGDVT
eukprot:353301-Pelagomonas_calceolata.AAC.1